MEKIKEMYQSKKPIKIDGREFVINQVEIDRQDRGHDHIIDQTITLELVHHETIVPENEKTPVEILELEANHLYNEIEKRKREYHVRSFYKRSIAGILSEIKDMQKKSEYVNEMIDKIKSNN